MAAAVERTENRSRLAPWWLVLIEGILAIIVGVLLWMYPIRAFITLSFFIGIYWIVSGIFDLVSLFVDRTAWGWKLFMGVIGILAGWFLVDQVLRGALTLSITIVWLVGLMGIFYGILGLIRGFTGAGWGAAILGILSIIFGGYILANRWAAVLAVPWMFGFLSVFFGFLAIFGAFALRKAQKAMKTAPPVPAMVRTGAGVPAGAEAAAGAAAAAAAGVAAAESKPAEPAEVVARYESVTITETAEGGPVEVVSESIVVEETPAGEMLVATESAVGEAAEAVETKTGEAVEVVEGTATEMAGGAGAVAAVAAGALAEKMAEAPEPAETPAAVAESAAGEASEAVETKTGQAVEVVEAVETKTGEAIEVVEETVSETAGGAVASAAPVADRIDWPEEVQMPAQEPLAISIPDVVDIPEEQARFLKDAIEYVEGIGPVYGAKLKAAGIHTTLDLLRKGATRKGRELIVEATGITGTLILKWVNHTDLYRLKGVGSEYADLLEASGVDTVVELAMRNPANLFNKMTEVNEAKNLVRKIPTEVQVEDWVAQAKGLGRIITY